jgi:sialidase-1
MNTHQPVTSGARPRRAFRPSPLFRTALAAALLLCAGSLAMAAEPAPSLVKVFEAGQGGYDTYRIPAIIVTQKGALLAFCEGRKNSASDSGDIDLVLRRSADNGVTWGPMQVVVDDGDSTCGNPVPIVDRNTGTIVLPFTKNKGSEKEDQIMKGEVPPRSVWVTRSRDEGATWSKPVEISAQVRPPDWRWYATGPCHGIQLADGRLVVPCNHSTGPKIDQVYSHVIFSEDGGVSWKLGGSAEGGTDESTVVELANGALYLNMRNNHGTNCRAYAVSQDKGMTWSPTSDDATLVEPVCQGSVLRLSTEQKGGKNRVLFANPASKRRENLTVRLSYDECKSWPVAKTLWPGPAAYSDLVASADGAIGCLFECGDKKAYETITYACFSLVWLSDGADLLP